MFGLRAAMSEPAGLAARPLEHPLGTRRDAQRALRRRVAAPDELVHVCLDVLTREAEASQAVRGEAGALREQREQQVLGAHVAMAEPPGFRDRLREDRLG